MTAETRAPGGDVLRALTEQATIQIPGVTTAFAAQAVEAAGYDAVGLDGPTWQDEATGRRRGGASRDGDGRPPIEVARLARTTERIAAAVRIGVVVDAGPLPPEPARARALLADLESAGAAAVIAGLPAALADGGEDGLPPEGRLTAAQRAAWRRTLLDRLAAGRRDEATILGLTVDGSPLNRAVGHESARQEADRSDRLDGLVRLAEEAQAAGVDWLVIAGVADAAVLERIAGRVPLPLVATFREGMAPPPDLATLAGLGYTAAIHADVLARVERHVRRTALSVMARDGGPQDLADLLRDPPPGPPIGGERGA